MSNRLVTLTDFETCRAVCQR